eukprot:1445950-Pyramimonas_sp.AAC.1
MFNHSGHACTKLSGVSGCLRSKVDSLLVAAEDYVRTEVLRAKSALASAQHRHVIMLDGAPASDRGFLPPRGAALTTVKHTALRRLVLKQKSRMRR